MVTGWSKPTSSIDFIRAFRSPGSLRWRTPMVIESIRRFPDQRGFARLMREQGLVQVEWRNLSFGIAALHSGRKPELHRRAG